MIKRCSRFQRRKRKEEYSNRIYSKKIEAKPPQPTPKGPVLKGENPYGKKPVSTVVQTAKPLDPKAALTSSDKTAKPLPPTPGFALKLEFEDHLDSLKNSFENYERLLKACNDQTEALEYIQLFKDLRPVKVFLLPNKCLAHFCAV